jgi:hypothetical protein
MLFLNSFDKHLYKNYFNLYTIFWIESNNLCINSWFLDFSQKSYEYNQNFSLKIAHLIEYFLSLFQTFFLFNKKIVSKLK